MISRKTIVFAVLLGFCVLISGQQPLRADLPGHYKEKRVFYDSLSVVLNKYIVPVGNWSLFAGTLRGLQSYVGPQFEITTETNRIAAGIRDNPPLLFSREEIDTNAIELIDSLSRVFDSVFERFGEYDKNSMIHAAIAGMVATLEPNSYFIDPQDLERIQAQNRGVFEGVGLEITARNDVVTVVSPYENTPAFHQGLLPFDRILAVDSVATKGMRIMAVSEKIRGEKGRPVTLTIERNGWQEPRDITLVRETISHRTVKAVLLEPGIGYIRLINFLGTTDNDFAAALAGLAKDAALKGLIIDLRNNPGGLLNQSLGIADFFLDTGVIATTEGRITADNKTYYARPDTLPADYPIVVLINNGSASGSEILAAALRTHQRAVLVGQRTFGKGYIQTIFPVQNGGAIRLTTSMLLTPDGDKIQDVGISPDLHMDAALPDHERTAENGAVEPETARDDEVVRAGMDILQRSLLLQDMPVEELENLSPQQTAIKKRFTGLQKAVQEISRLRGLTF